MEENGLDYLIGIKAKAEKYDEVLNILWEVLEWIKNWEVDFLDDPEWEPLEERIREALKGK